MASETARVPTEWVGLNHRGATYIGISTVFVVLASASVALRIWTRWRGFHRLFADDFFCIASMAVAFVVYVEGIIWSTLYGLGWHVTDVPPAQLERFFIIFYIAELSYAVISPLYKLSVLFLYRRIFGEVKLFNIAMWTTVALCLGWGVAGFLSVVFQCDPVNKVWMSALKGHCIDSHAQILGTGIANLLIDVTILALPVPVIWNLQLSSTKKLALTGMFLLGSFVCVASIVRVTTTVNLNLEDPTYSLINVAIWSEIEPAVGIISACLPTLRQFFWHKYAGSQSSRARDGQSTLESTAAKSDIAMALTGYRNSASRYAEIDESNSPAHVKPSFLSTTAARSEHGDDASRARTLDDSDDKSIFVTKEVSVQHAHK